MTLVAHLGERGSCLVTPGWLARTNDYRPSLSPRITLLKGSAWGFGDLCTIAGRRLNSICNAIWICRPSHRSGLSFTFFGRQPTREIRTSCNHYYDGGPVNRSIIFNTAHRVISNDNRQNCIYKSLLIQSTTLQIDSKINVKWLVVVGFAIAVHWHCYCGYR